MIRIIGAALYQWDTGRSVEVTTEGATHAHFANVGDAKAPIIALVDGKAKIPDYLFQTGKQLCVYAVNNGVTIEKKVFPVTKRERPENYVYDEDQRNFIYELIASAEDATEAANQAAVGATQSAQNAVAAAANADKSAAAAMAATEDARKASANANAAAEKAAQTAKSLMVVGGASGTNIYLDNAIEQHLVGLRIFGKTTQDGTPTPYAPVELVSVGDSGSITVNVTGENEAQSMTIATPNGLPGIPAASGGNYTDANGQQWICDERDFARGVLVKRTGMVDMGTLKATLIQVAAGNLFRFEVSNIKVSMSSTIMPNILCEAYPTVRTGDRTHGTLSMPVNSRNVDIINNDYTDADTLKAAVSGVMLLYELATPIETSLSAEELAAYSALHTYRNHTNVSNDAGAWMELEYVMDAKKYIDGLMTGTILPATVE